MPDPATTIPTDDAARGIAKSLSGFVIQNYEITEAPQRQEYPDQQGAIRAGAKYDTRYDLSATVYCAGAAGDPPASGDTFSFDGHDWKLDTCKEAGTYNDLLRYAITAHRYTNWPTGGSGSST